MELWPPFPNARSWMASAPTMSADAAMSIRRVSVSPPCRILSTPGILDSVV